MNPTLKETKKLFYKKWIYKIGLNIAGVGVLRDKSGEELEYFLSELPFSFPANRYPQSVQARAVSSKNTLIKLTLLLQSYDKSTYSKRIESDFFDVYTNNKMLLDEIQTEFSKYVRLVSKPKTKNIDLLLKNEHSIFVKTLPKNKYEYRVYLKPHRVPNDKKDGFITWLADQGDKTSLSESLIDWFIKCTMNWDRRYILVDNEKTLLMIKLHTPEAIGTVYKYEVVDK